MSPPIVVSQIVSPRFVLSLRDPRPLSFRKAPPLPNLVFCYILLRCLPALCRFAKCLPTLCCFAKGPPALCRFAEGPPVLGRSAQVAPRPPFRRSAKGAAPPLVVPQRVSPRPLSFRKRVPSPAVVSQRVLPPFVVSRRVLPSYPSTPSPSPLSTRVSRPWMERINATS